MKVKNLLATQLFLNLGRVLIAIAIAFVSGLQACGGSEGVTESPSLTPTVDALKKDWVDQSPDDLLALGEVKKP